MTLHLSAFPTHLYVEDHAFDVGIQYDDAVWRGARRRPLMDERCVVVGVPYSRWRADAERGDFRNTSLLQLKTDRRGSSRRYCRTGRRRMMQPDPTRFALTRRAPRDSG